MANEAVKGAIRSYSEAIRSKIVAETDRFNAGKASVDTWNRRVRGLIKEAATASGIVASGGKDQFSDTARQRTEREVKHQFGYFRDLVAGVKDGSIEKGDALSARAGLYGGTATRGYEAVRRQVNGTSYKEEKRVLSAGARHCDPCISYANRRWVPVGTLPDIGDECECLSNCRCSFVYQIRQKGEPAEIALAPLPGSPVVDIEDVASPSTKTPGKLLPTDPVLPGRPIAERLAAYTDGDRHVDEIAALGAESRIARRDYREANFRIDSIPERLRESTDEAEITRLSKVYESSIKERAAARIEIEKATLKAREKIKELIGVPDPVSWNHTITGKAADSIRTQVHGSDDFINPIFQGYKPGQEVNSKWVARVKSGYRANYDGNKREINIHTSDDIATAIHERGHQIENEFPGIGLQARRFLKYRIGDETAKPMGNGYDADETGHDDQFHKFFGEVKGRYVGKVYPKDTEILSMGLEALHNDPVGFAQKDPEYAKFIIGILRGPLR